MISRSKKPSANHQNKPKKKPIPRNIRQRCLTAMQKLRRLEEANDDGYVRCISCGKVMHWKEAQGGHYIRRTCQATELEKDNIWPQCPQCNCQRNGNPIPYRYNLVRMIGAERVQRLEDMRAAYYGDEAALEKLRPEDRSKVSGTKGKMYYASVYQGISKELSDAEKEKSAIC